MTRQYEGTKWADIVARNQRILDEPRGQTECVCGAVGGSAHNHDGRRSRWRSETGYWTVKPMRRAS